MADVIKKATILSASLTELDWEANGYFVRYRIKSENKNLSSHWSPAYILDVGSFDLIDGSYSENIGEDGKINVTVVWDDVYSRPLYDIFVAFRGLSLEDTSSYDGDDFFYHGISPTHNYSFLKKEGTESLRIVVQPAANKKIIKPNFVVYDSDVPAQEYDEYGYDEYEYDEYS